MIEIAYSKSQIYRLCYWADYSKVINAPVKNYKSIGVGGCDIGQRFC